ncbi:MAG: pilus assembly protein [Pseudomonadota bacterium]
MTHLNTDAGRLAPSAPDVKATSAISAISAIPRLLKLPALAALLALTACAQTTPRADAVFGDTVRVAVARQTMNPDASKNTDPVSGMDARAARDGLDRYHKSFKEPAPHPSVFTIGVGSGGG